MQLYILMILFYFFRFLGRVHILMLGSEFVVFLLGSKFAVFDYDSYVEQLKKVKFCLKIP